MKPVVRSVEDEHGERCVDFLVHADGTCTYRLCRKDPEDYGRWSIVADYSAVVFPSFTAAYSVVRQRFAWLPEQTPCPARPPAPRSSA